MGAAVAWLEKCYRATWCSGLMWSRSEIYPTPVITGSRRWERYGSSKNNLPKVVIATDWPKYSGDGQSQFGLRTRFECGSAICGWTSDPAKNWNSDWDNKALHSKYAINKLFIILIEVILVTQVCPEYQPISHKVYLIIAQIWQGAFENSLPERQLMLNLNFAINVLFIFFILDGSSSQKYFRDQL